MRQIHGAATVLLLLAAGPRNAGGSFSCWSAVGGSAVKRETESLHRVHRGGRSTRGAGSPVAASGRDGPDPSPRKDPSPLASGRVSDPGRRAVLGSAGGLWLVAGATANARGAHAAVAVAAGERSSPPPLDLLQQRAESSDLPDGLLESRVSENVLSPPSYGMEGDDIYYPGWFRGTWQVASTTSDVLAPCGPALFGGNITYRRARDEIGTTLVYASRFLPVTVAHESPSPVASAAYASHGADSPSPLCVADRDYNVRSIAKAAMGSNSVVDVSLAQPNRFSCTLAPSGSPDFLTVDLLTLNRRQESPSDNQFDCSEVVRELVRPVSSGSNAGRQGGVAARSPVVPIAKEVETTSLYTYDPQRDQIRCRQRSASFLVPSQSDPVALQLWQASRGRPVDVRFYDVLYTRP